MKPSDNNPNLESNDEIEILEEHEISQTSLEDDLKNIHNTLTDNSWSFGYDLARISLFFGVSQFLFFWLLLPGPAAVLFGYKSLKSLKRGEKGRAKAWTGLLLGCLGVAAFFAFFIWLYLTTIEIL